MVLKHCFKVPIRENNVSRAGNTSKQVFKLGNIVPGTKMLVNFLGNIFASSEANFVSATTFPEVSEDENNLS